MANSVLNYIINVVKKGSGDKQTLTALQSVKSMMMGVAAVAGAATAAYVIYDKTLAESTRFTVKYADEVRKLMSVTKQNAKETSIMKQVADDYKVTNDQLLIASKKLATQGHALNIKTLAKLSDEYKSLTTAQQKQQFLTQNFGKTGSYYIELLEAGSDALLKQADAVNKNLILTNEQVRAARELEIAEDNLLETKEALYLAVGTRYIPVWTKYLESLTEVAEGGNALKVILGNLTWFLGDNAEAAGGAAKGHRELRDAMGEEIDMAEDLKDALGGAKDSGAEMAAKMVEASLVMDGFLSPDDVQKLLDFRLQMGLLTQEEYNAAQEALTLKGAIDGLPAEKQIDISVYYHTYGFMPGQLLSNNAPVNATFGAEPGGGSVVNNTTAGDDYSSTTQRAAGGPAIGWTMVGEHGKELIDPGGYVHSNAESRRLVQAGMTPFRSLAVGGDLGFSEPGDVFNPVVTPTGIASLPTLSSFIASGGSFTALAAAARGGSSSAPAVVQAAQTSAAAAEVAAQSSTATSVSIQQTEQLAGQLAEGQGNTEALLRSIDRRLSNMPSQIHDAFQQVIQQ